MMLSLGKLTKSFIVASFLLLSGCAALPSLIGAAIGIGGDLLIDYNLPRFDPEEFKQFVAVKRDASKVKDACGTDAVKPLIEKMYDDADVLVYYTLAVKYNDKTYEIARDIRKIVVDLKEVKAPSVFFCTETADNVMTGADRALEAINEKRR